MSKVRVVFMGTPDFAVTCLRRMYEDTHFDIVGVITQPDRPAGRKLQLQPTPVKSFAMAHGLRVISPETVSNELIQQEVEKWGAEIAVVVAFGQILKEDFMQLFPLGCVNVHASILPRWRGAAPIQRSIEVGDQETGVALQRMVKKLDAGDVLGIRRLKITDDMDAMQLHDQLAVLGGELLHIELMDYVRGNLHGIPQDESQVTVAKKLLKTETELDWKNSAISINRKIRAFKMGPGTWTTLEGLKIKIHKTRIFDLQKVSPNSRVTEITDEGFVIQCGEGQLEILEVQPDSKKVMSGKEFVRGYEVKVGQVLGGPVLPKKDKN